jgi:alcohol dehydrogenase class IV
LTLNPFRHFVSATRTFYGDGCLAQLAGEIKRSGCSRAVVFSGRTLARSEPGVATIRAALGEVCVGNFDGVAEHSPIASVQAAAKLLRELKADAVIALGGGSAVVTARAASIRLGEGKDVTELCTVFEPGKPPRSPKLAAPKLPQFLIPTTPTTACAKAGAAVAAENGLRLSLFDPKVRAQAVFFDPALFVATPARLIREAALDAFGAAIQGLESKSRQPLADALLLHGVRLIRRNLGMLDAAEQPADVRGELMLASLMVGQGTDATAGGVAAAIGHCVGARFGVANGLVNAIMLPHTVRFNASVIGNQLADAAEVLGVAEAEMGDGASPAVSRACAGFFASLGLPARLRDIGVDREAIPAVADVSSRDWFYTQNPRPVAREDCIAILEAAW